MAGEERLSGSRSRSRRGGQGRPEQTEAEMVRAELARVRARCSVDPAVVSGVLAEAWTSPTGAVEDDEAEFVDALADCLSVGVPLGAAVASWVSGALAHDDARDEDVYDEIESGASGEIYVSAGRRIIVR